MHRLPGLFLLPLLLLGCTSQQINQTLQTVLNGGLTPTEIGNGLKEALRLGAREGAEELAQPGGYFDDLTYRILLPEEVRQVTDRLQNVPGFSNIEEVILKKINQGAEDAASKAAPIFVDAIRQMTIQDAVGILRGENDAATQYLSRTTSDALTAEFARSSIPASTSSMRIKYGWMRPRPTTTSPDPAEGRHRPGCLRDRSRRSTAIQEGGP